MSPDPFGALTVERLDTSNYLIWAPRMEYFLTTKGLWEAVTTDDAPAADCRKARAIIGLCVTSQHLATIQRSKTAKEAWDSLAAIFKTKGTALKLRLRRDLSSFKMAAGEPLTKYFARAKALQDKLLESFPDFKEEDIFWPTVSLKALAGVLAVLASSMPYGEQVFDVAALGELDGLGGAVANEITPERRWRCLDRELEGGHELLLMAAR